MPGLRRVAVALGACVVSCAASATALQTLNDCAAQASVQAAGMAVLERECPGLDAALGELGYAAMLPDGWRDRLDQHAVRDLAALAAHAADAANAPHLEASALRRVLDQLAAGQGKTPRSRWDAFREWLRSWLARQDGGSSAWLDRLLNRLAPSAILIKAFTYTLLLITVAAAVWLVVNELRVAGLLSRGGRRAAPRARASGGQSPAPAPAVLQLDGAALRDQPAVLLRLLVMRLLATGQLSSERSLTHQELVQRTAFADAQQRQCFAGVAQLAERILYGSAPEDPSQTAAVLSDGRALLHRLQAAGAERA